MQQAWKQIPALPPGQYEQTAGKSFNKGVFVKAFVIAVASVVLSVCSFSAAQAADKHLFYVHGCCVKSADGQVAKDYESIVQKIRDSGFNVEYQLRTADVGDSNDAVQAYAAQIADKVNALLANGTPPKNITVAGYSLGSMTTLVAAGLIANPNVNIVLLAGCPANATINIDIDYSKVKGNILSVTDKGDSKFGSCEGKLPEGNTFKEVALDSGKGHTLFRMPADNFTSLWMNPMMDWINVD
jgi:hypothetical protein